MQSKKGREKIILRKFDFDIDKREFLWYAIKAKFNTEAYRSGHNEAVLKICEHISRKKVKKPCKH